MSLTGIVLAGALTLTADQQPNKSYKPQRLKGKARPIAITREMIPEELRYFSPLEQIQCHTSYQCCPTQDPNPNEFDVGASKLNQWPSTPKVPFKYFETQYGNNGIERDPNPEVEVPSGFTKTSFPKPQSFTSSYQSVPRGFYRLQGNVFVPRS